MQDALLNLVYLVASVLFIFGIKGLTHPRTAVRGNLISAVGMLLAVVITLLANKVVGWPVVIAGLVVGSAVGAALAVRIPMTAMPQLVGLFNGFGGGASVFVAWSALVEATSPATGATEVVLPSAQMTVATAASGLIGAVTFWGSMVAFAKLQEIKAFRKPLHFSGQQALNVALFIASIGACAWVVAQPQHGPWIYFLLVVVASVLGLLVTMPIGGADMPVAIALLNSLSGLAAAATGFVLNNNMLIIAGSLVGASGIVLTLIMCRAMNRSIAHVLFGKLGPTADTASDDEVYAGKVKSTSADEVAMLMDGVQHVMIVPGYGMAVSQAQHTVRDLCNALEARGTEVNFAIHPVAGRMPGHMNVLLAEVDIPYDKLKEMDVANPMFEQTDVTIVLGANDVVNPDARKNPNSPIAGMPILDVDKSKTVIVIKRSLSPGFAGIPNPLFAADNTLMFFGDGKKAVQDLLTAVKEL
ncbi:MAG: NAD(P)(+) transhydrogenase (Re/Si-specific) subunit beta [Phycisphaerae bacterium]|nr:NAD(P)(+) transhydrogenase (Re/Si-specific) subunit beta [Phycisphaerae bacterium]